MQIGVPVRRVGRIDIWKKGKFSRGRDPAVGFYYPLFPDLKGARVHPLQIPQRDSG